MFEYMESEKSGMTHGYKSPDLKPNPQTHRQHNYTQGYAAGKLPAVYRNNVVQLLPHKQIRVGTAYYYLQGGLKRDTLEMKRARHYKFRCGDVINDPNLITDDPLQIYGLARYRKQMTEERPIARTAVETSFGGASMEFNTRFKSPFITEATGTGTLKHKYVDIIEELRKEALPSVRTKAEKDSLIAKDLLFGSTGFLISHEQQRYAALFLSIIGIAEEERKTGAGALARHIIGRIANGEITFDEFLTEFAFVKKASAGREQVTSIFELGDTGVALEKYQVRAEEIDEVISDAETEDYKSRGRKAKRIKRRMPYRAVFMNILKFSRHDPKHAPDAQEVNIIKSICLSGVSGSADLMRKTANEPRATKKLVKFIDNYVTHCKSEGRGIV